MDGQPRARSRGDGSTVVDNSLRTHVPWWLAVTPREAWLAQADPWWLAVSEESSMASEESSERAVDGLRSWAGRMLGACRDLAYAGLAPRISGFKT